MNFLAGWMVFVGLILVASAIKDVAKAIEKHQCVQAITGDTKK